METIGNLIKLLLLVLPVLAVVLFVGGLLVWALHLFINAISARTHIRRWQLRALASVILIGSVAGYCTHGYRQDERMRRESYARAEALKADLDAHFSTGATQDEVVRFLQTKVSPPAWGGLEHYRHDLFVIFVGKKPSGVWYCGPVDVGVQAEFADQRLVGTMITARALDCL